MFHKYLAKILIDENKNGPSKKILPHCLTHLSSLFCDEWFILVIQDFSLLFLEKKSHVQRAFIPIVLWRVIHNHHLWFFRCFFLGKSHLWRKWWKSSGTRLGNRQNAGHFSSWRTGLRNCMSSWMFRNIRISIFRRTSYDLWSPTIKRNYCLFCTIIKKLSNCNLKLWNRCKLECECSEIFTKISCEIVVTFLTVSHNSWIFAIFCMRSIFRRTVS